MTGREALEPLTRMMVVAAVAVVSAVAAGCASDGPSGGRLAMERDSAGVVIVENEGPGAWGDAAWRVEEAHVLAGDDGRPETQFGYVADVAVDADTLYVLDQQAQQVRVFGPDGGLLRTVGRAGEGPGELSTFATSVLLRGDTLLVADWGRGRLHRFRRDGTFVDATLFPGAGGRSWWRVAGGGDLYYRALERITDETGQWRGRDRLLRVTPAWDAPDTVLTFDYPQTDVGARGAPKVPVVVNAPTWDVLPDGRVVWTTLEDARVRIHGPDGALRRIVASDRWTSNPPTLAERDRLLDLLRERLTMLGGAASLVERFEVPYPAVMPVLSTVRAGPAGTIWVQRVDGAADAHPMAINTPDPPTGWGGARWDVLDGNGAYLGTVTLSPRTRVTRVLDDRVVGVRWDELDREEVVVWRLVR